jgi:hypothetical protein
MALPKSGSKNALQYEIAKKAGSIPIVHGISFILIPGHNKQKST